jgi:SET domain-containing protein
MVEVKEARIGKGVFAKKLIKAGSIILEIKGRLLHWERLNDIGGKIQDNSIRFGENTYLSPDRDMGRFLNHSCEPNSKIVKRARKLCVIALVDIPTGKEVTFDYSTTIGDDDIWKMDCKCKARSCRKRIRRFGSLPQKTKEKYIELQMVPSYILSTLE